MIDIKDVVIPFLGLAVSLVLGGSGLVDFIISEKSSVFIGVVPNNKTTDSTATVNVTNRGSAPATHLKLTLDAPGKIYDYDVNSTEDYEVYTKNSTSLVLNIPRFIHGEGSVIKVNLKLENISSSGSDDYIVYATYDQGSFRVDVPAIQHQQRVLPLSVQEQIIVFWNTYGYAITLFIAAIVAGVSALIIDKFYKEKRPPVLIGVSPEKGSSNVPIDMFITATFDKPIDSSAVTPDTFHVKSIAAGTPIAGTIKIAPGNRTISFEPETVLNYSTTYLATVSGLFRAKHGSGQNVIRTWSFTTIDIRV